MGVLHLCGLQGGSVIYGWSDDLGTTWKQWSVIAPADGGVPPSLWLDPTGCLAIQFAQSGSTKTILSRTHGQGGDWHFAGNVGP